VVLNIGMVFDAMLVCAGGKQSIATERRGHAHDAPDDLATLSVCRLLCDVEMVPFSDIDMPPLV